MTTPNQLQRERKQKFINQVSCLLQPDELKGTSLFKFLRHFAKRWHVSHVDIEEVITEGVKRGLNYIDTKQVEIHSPEAWLRQVCLNILRGKVEAIIKEEKKVQSVKILRRPSRSPLIETELIEQLEFLEAALERLSPDDRGMIRLRFIHGKNYKQIQYHYKLQGQGVSIQALRKRESRALQRLKEYFFDLYDGRAGKSP